MDLETLTLRLPKATYQRLVELATQSERPLAEETVHVLNSVLEADAELSFNIASRLNQLSLLTNEELWKTATVSVSEEENDLMQSLLEKRQRESLNEDELEQLAALSERFNQIMLVRAKSTAILSERGLDISVMNPTPLVKAGFRKLCAYQFSSNFSLVVLIAKHSNKYQVFD
ncbi:MAG: hypothetical protein AAFY72_15435 [Cyanobacteria bacterium J06649_4]